MTNKKAKGKRGKTRHLMKRKHTKKGITKLFTELKENQTVRVNIDSSIHKGMPAALFQGKTGRITGKRGNCFEVEIKNGKMKKTIIAGAAHLMELKGVEKK